MRKSGEGQLYQVVGGMRNRSVERKQAASPFDEISMSVFRKFSAIHPESATSRQVLFVL